MSEREPGMDDERGPDLAAPDASATGTETAEVESEAVLDSTAGKQPDGEPDQDLEPRSTAGAPEELQSETAPGPEAQAEPEPEAEPQPAAEPEPEAEPQPEAESEAPAPTPTAVSAGRAAAEELAAAGVKLAFTVPGESFLGILDALGDAGIRVVAARHEGGAAFMAEAIGQLTGRPAVCLATRAVGAANLAIGLHTASQDSSPMIALVGQVRREFLGREAFQEVDHVSTFGRLTKWTAQAARGEDVPGLIETALDRATAGRPGPVLLSVPEDVLEDTLPVGWRGAPGGHRQKQANEPDASTVRRILHLLAGAERPVILAGAGVLRARASDALVKVAELLSVPVVAAWRRPDVFPNDHPLYLGMTGYGAPSTVFERLEAADALLVLGCRLNEVASFGYRIPADGARWAHVDMEPRIAANGTGREGPVRGLGPATAGAIAKPLPLPTIALASDAAAFLRVARRLLAGAAIEASVLDRRRALGSADREAFERASAVDEGAWDGPGVHPGRVVAALGRLLPHDAIVTTDAGNFGGWLARGYRFRRPGTFLGPTSGAMGYGLPAAIAASLARPGRTVVALAGDGGFAMTMAELETAVRERTRVVVLVFDNRRFGTIHAHQDQRGTGVGVATELGPVDFAAVATAFGALGLTVERDDEVEPAIERALAAGRPALVHLHLDRRWVSVDRGAVDLGDAAIPGDGVVGTSLGPDELEIPDRLPGDARPGDSAALVPEGSEAPEVPEASEPLEEP